jgi:hypothetical protein
VVDQLPGFVQKCPPHNCKIVVIMGTGVSRLAKAHGAAAVEGFPLSGGERRPTGEAYLGTEAMFASLGFQPRERPSPRRVIM